MNTNDLSPREPATASNLSASERANLADQAIEYQRLKDAGRLSPESYYAALTGLLNASRPDAALPSSAEIAVTNTRRIEALVQDKFGASGGSLREMVDSIESQLDDELLSQLRYLAAIPLHMHDAHFCLETPAEVQGRFDWTLFQLVHLPPSGVAKGDVNVGIKLYLPVRTVRGVVQKIGLSKQSNGPNHVALLDVDGRIVLFSRIQSIQIGLGDRIVIVGRGACCEAGLYYNESRGAGDRGIAAAFLMPIVISGAIALAGLAAVALALTFAFHRAHGLAQVLDVWPHALAVLLGGAVCYVGLAIMIILYKAKELQRTLDSEIIHSSGSDSSQPSGT